MSVIQLLDGTQAFILNSRDLIDIAYNTLGSEYSAEIEKVIQSSTEAEIYAEKRFNSDMNSYEGQIETYRDCMLEVVEIAENLLEYINETKKIDRLKITQELEKVFQKLNSEL